MNFFKSQIHRVYDKMLDLSGRQTAMYWLFTVAFAESSFFPIPPDVMLIPMILATPQKAWKIAFVALCASVLGGYAGYAIGMFGYEMIAKPLIAFYGYTDAFAEFSRYYHEWGAWIVFVAGITPFPYKVITITSGALDLNLLVFGVASLLARGIRFYLVAYLLYRFGAPMKIFIEKNLGILSVLFVLLLLGGFYLLKFL